MLLHDIEISFMNLFGMERTELLSCVLRLFLRSVGPTLWGSFCALNRPSIMGGSLLQVGETANSTGLNRCLIFYEFVNQ
jgi:hypothetical protein